MGGGVGCFLPQEGSSFEETDASCLALSALENWEGT